MGPRMPMPHAGPRMGPMSMPPGVFDLNDPELYRKMLAELRSSDLNRRRLAVAVLAHVEPKEMRQEITKALEPLMGDSDDMLRSECLKALDVWSTDVVPIAIRALGDSGSFVRNTALELLERRKDPRAIEPMIALLSDPMNMRVAKSLEQMGSPVEDAVLARYDSGNDHARRFIIQILGAVATEKGLAKLRQIAADKRDRSSAVFARFMLHRRGETVAD
jgi:HEAT repeat protein